MKFWNEYEINYVLCSEFKNFPFWDVPTSKHVTKELLLNFPTFVLCLLQKNWCTSYHRGLVDEANHIRLHNPMANVKSLQYFVKTYSGCPMRIFVAFVCFPSNMSVSYFVWSGSFNYIWINSRSTSKDAFNFERRKIALDPIKCWTPYWQFTPDTS